MKIRITGLHQEVSAMYGKTESFIQKQKQHIIMQFLQYHMKTAIIHIQLNRNGERFMERNSRNSQGYKLESQIREAYGRVTYSQTCHDKFINRTVKLEDRIKVAQIVLSVIAQEHKKASDLLWKIREEYVSLLTDFEMLDANAIRNKRDELQERTSEVYSNSPRTDAKSYTAAQKALKTEEEQTFSEEEIDIMLPNSIRRCNRQMVE